MFTVLFIDWSSQRLSQVQREGTLISLQRNTEICSATFTEGIQWWRILRSCFKATEFNGNNITTYHLVKATIYLEITLSHHLLSLPFGFSVTSDSAAPWTARSRPGLPVLHYLLEFAQTPVQWFGDAIQPPHSLSPLSPPALNLPSIRVFSNESTLGIPWPKCWSFSPSVLQHQSLLWIFKTDFL